MNELRPCWYRMPGNHEYVGSIRTWVNKPWQRGLFHQFAMDHIEYESGPGMNSVAVIEDAETHRVHTPFSSDVSFAEDCPAD